MYVRDYTILTIQLKIHTFKSDISINQNSWSDFSVTNSAYCMPDINAGCKESQVNGHFIFLVNFN